MGTQLSTRLAAWVCLVAVLAAILSWQRVVIVVLLLKFAFPYALGQLVTRIARSKASLQLTVARAGFFRASDVAVVLPRLRVTIDTLGVYCTARGWQKLPSFGLRVGKVTCVVNANHSQPEVGRPTTATTVPAAATPLLQQQLPPAALPPMLNEGTGVAGRAVTWSGVVWCERERQWDPGR